MRESMGMAEIKASTLAADTLQLLEASRLAGMSGDPDDLVVFDTPRGSFIMQLAPQFAPAHVAAIRRLIP